MGSKFGGNPYRSAGRVRSEAPENWPTDLERLKQRKAQRGTPSLRRWVGKRPTRAAVVSQNPIGRGAEVQGPLFIVECRAACSGRSATDLVLSIQWRQSETQEDHQIDGKVRARLNEIKKAHAHCVARLYAVAHGKCDRSDPELADLRQNLAELTRLLVVGGVDIAISGYGGFTYRLAESISLFDEFVAHFSTWGAGAPSARVVALAVDSLRALGLNHSDPERG